jgi:hypothetical protein
LFETAKLELKVSARIAREINSQDNPASWPGEKASSCLR